MIRRRRILPAIDKIKLTDLIPLNELQDMQESFAEVSCVTVRTVDPNGVPLTKASNLSSFCSETRCLPTFLGGEGIIEDDFSFECIPGLKQYLVPLKVSLSPTSSLILGYIILGPVVFMKRKEKEEYGEAAEKLGLDLEHFWDWVLELRIFSFRGIRSLLDMIEHMTGRILNLAYAKMTMQKKISAQHSAKILGKEVASGEYLNEFLQTFLDFVMSVTGGSAGSIMLFDRYKGTLEIRYSHGLPNGVAQKTSIKLGEGVSGLAAEMKKPFIINEGSADVVLRGRLTKPDLFSSLVVPIKRGDDVYGVVNVSSDISRPVRFDDASLALLTRAAGVAGIILENLQS